MTGRCCLPAQVRSKVRGASSAHPFNPISVDDYVEGELLAKNRREFVDGRVYAMSGAKNVHNRIASRVLISLGAQLNFSEVYAGIQFETSEPI